MKNLIEQYYRLILHSEAQRFAIAIKEGNEVKYPHQSRHLTEADIIKSIEGKLSLGVMLLTDNSPYLTKSGVIDIDTSRDAKDLIEGLALAKKLKDTALECNLRAYIEFSGNRGYHLWIFVNKPITGELMQKCLRAIALKAKFEAKEVFPNHDVKETKCIKLPFTTHLKSNNRSGFIREDFNPNNPLVTLESQSELMRGFSQNDPSDIISLVNEVGSKDNPVNSEVRSKNEITDKLKSLGDHPSCIKHLLTNGAPLEVDYNQANLTLIRYCLTRGLDLTESLKLAEVMAKNTPENHPSSKDYEGKLKNFRSAFNSCDRNRDNYKFECSYVLSGVKEGEAYSKRGCVGTKCKIHFNYSENEADTPNNQNNPRYSLINALIFDAMINLSSEGKECAKSQILRECEKLEQNYLVDEDNRTISDSIRLIESEVIGYFLHNPEAILDYSDIFPNGFIAYNQINQTISDYIDYCLSLKLPSPETIEEYLEEIREKGINLVASENFKTYQDLLKEADNLEILNKSIEETEKLLNNSFNDKLTLPLEAHLAHLYESLFTEDIVSISTPSKHLNNVLNGGFMKGKLYVIGAPPASGKSTFCAWCGDYASSNGFKVVYASYEMSREQLFTASLSRISGINSALIESRKWLDETYPHRETLEMRIERGITEIAENLASNLHILECDESYTPNKLKTVCKKLKVDLLIVDYLQLLSSGDQKLDNAYQETLRVSKIATELKRLARYLNIPIIAISDINKDAYNKAISGGTLDMGALRDSFKIAHSADVILLLQSGTITVGKGNEKQQINQLDLLEKDYPEKSSYVHSLKSKYPLNSKRADTYSRLSIVKNRGGKLGVPIFRYSRALHDFEPLDFDIEINQDDCEF
ncbi:DnaB-like helicase C-terminal domain-containing protein [Cyanobacterium sp. DS4]|uniref:DnaB-like helicase C-terminal domain-containing protein n=1 Tax=Cyanobacterium sp. DS4 TaxID=2878255 RepID=UPI002E820286|nr:DnaB-like helicase C-terminal domain-containing protein [Cyanobacterium sp. Dongsha4]WVL02512.1 hypothetical protein Dongsha4_18630 [Cyanobacterium sp. Dongsha4]